MKVSQVSLIKEVAEDTGLEINDIKLIIESFIKIVKKHLFNGNAVNLTKFVKFKIESAAAKKTYNFSLKQVCELPPRQLPKAEFNPDFINQIKDTGN
jgi:nucleoid DNA-binding protein